MALTDEKNRYITIECEEYILKIEELLPKVSNLSSMSSIKRFKAKAIEIIEIFRLEIIQKEYNRVN